MNYEVKYYDLCWGEVSTYECKAYSKSDAEISFRRNVSSNVQRYKILKVKEKKNAKNEI